MPTQFSTAVVSASQVYGASLDAHVQVGELAIYLSQIETNLEASTLELAKRISWDQSLQNIDIQSGDHLLIFGREPQANVLPTISPSGYKIVKFSNRTLTMTSGAKQSLLVGKSGEGQQQAPDIDLRRFIPQNVVDYISRNCLSLNRLPDGAWQIVRVGNTRVLLDEIEVGQKPIPLSSKHRLRFYRGSDTGFSGSALGEIELSVETIQTEAKAAEIETGSIPVKIRLGQESNNQILRASEKLPIKQVIDAVNRYTKAVIPADAHVYRTRVLPPTTTLGSLNLGSDMFLYAALSQQTGQHVLILRDGEHEYRIAAGGADEVKTLGCRLREEHPDLSLDIDLYDLIVKRGYNPQGFHGDTVQIGQIMFNAAEKLWQLKLDHQAGAILFVNNVRIKNGTFIPLISGDIIGLNGDKDELIHLEIKLMNQNS